MPANPKLSNEVHPGTKKSFSSLVQNILIRQILTSNLVSVHNPRIPTHTSVLADRSSLSTLRYPLLVVFIWDASRNPVAGSSPLFSCTSLLAACWLVIAALLVTRHKAYGTSSFSLINVRCRWYPVAHCVLTSTFSPVVLAEDISYSPFTGRCLLYASPFMLLTTCYPLLPLCCLLAVYCLALASRLLDPFFLVARPSPLTARLPNAYYMPIAITCWQLTTHHSLFSVFDSSLTNRSFLFVVSY